MQQPIGYNEGQPYKVCKLHRAIYGLKQAPRAWYHTLASTLRTLGFRHTTSDVALFTTKTNNSDVTYMLIYVDDIIVTGFNSMAIDSLIKQLNCIFSLKDLGLFHFFLGLEAHYLPYQTLLLTQTKYAKDLIHRAGMGNSNPMPTPMMTSLKLRKSDSNPYEDPKGYRSIVGALQYLTITQLDLAFAVNKVSQFMHSPTINHWKAVKWILRYL
ncbi:uncharacterized protein LOC110263007 [Arachis ipaensis]|uniref:uncharacterized protein LOC110263007 n=1 Tax=Arachis ipaensis TaxID=130454 RepID=UPI000A2B8095|nr:uncharacterized protein LOC110263007 [Arachis ipaensis]